MHQGHCQRLCWCSKSTGNYSRSRATTSPAGERERVCVCVCVWDCVNRIVCELMQFAVLLFVDVCVCVHSTCQTLGYAHPTMKALQKQGKTPTLSLRIVCSFNNVPCIQCTVVSQRREEIRLVGWWFCIWVYYGGGRSLYWLLCNLFCFVVWLLVCCWWSMQHP